MNCEEKKNEKSDKSSARFVVCWTFLLSVTQGQKGFQKASRTAFYITFTKYPIFFEQPD